MTFLEHFHRGKKTEQEAMPERGRTMTGTGRGGAGNVRAHSLPQIHYAKRDAANDEDDAPKETPHIMHVGRGGVGNVRSPSRDPADRRREEHDERELDEMQDAELRQHYHTTGRGGRGNMPMPQEEERGRRSTPTGPGRVAGLVRSLSRSRSRDPSEARRRESSVTRRSNLDQVAE
ncbi:hypothetical protein MBRA1_002673 [Malassezia brasiliensis]|uniref:Uncharacterized protein n=1 Tax=Malassezia brasiliensis TaxID=1821822 RepID=A0AAF0IPD9_9BASI|nr:hypothetical protein MBRA1_002673 [Malassezia brasiliensis]